MNNKTIPRDGYFLTKAERQFILQYINDNPNLTYEQIGDHFRIAKSTVHNIKREARNREYYEKKISELTNQINLMAEQMFKLKNEILRLQRK